MKKKKTFLISIDTEGDNLWNWKPGDKITTENTKYLPRFQELCNQYGFKPTYLTNYEMATDDAFVSFAKEELKNNNCEIGMHLHAWNSPPDFDLIQRTDGLYGSAYLLEYPKEIMEQKISYMTRLLADRFETRPITHRAGRWAMNGTYFELLSQYGYQVDCSVTPGISWENCPGFSENSKGTDYTIFPTQPYSIENTDILEVPVTVRENHRFRKPPNRRIISWCGSAYRAVKGTGKIWLRPTGSNLENMFWLADRVDRSNSAYLMFMLHSSELMPGGSPTFSTEEKIEKLYADLRELFAHVSSKYEGMTIGDFSAVEKGKKQ